jgi:protein gp37
MAKNTNIEWTDNSFNPWIGCSKVSEGCENCYAEAGDNFRHWTPMGWGPGKPRHRTSAENWKEPLKWDRAAAANGIRTRVFCASLADVFDQEVDPSWRSDLWELIRQCPHLDWQILTKRPEFIASCLPGDWGTGWRRSAPTEATLHQRHDAVVLLRRRGYSTRFMNAHFKKLGASKAEITGTVSQWLNSKSRVEMSELLDQLK